MIQGIYEIVCSANNKKYIGSTTNLEYRWKQHLANLCRKTHHNKDLQKDFNRYGERQFSVRLVEECNQSDMGKREGAYLRKASRTREAFYNNRFPVIRVLVDGTTYESIREAARRVGLSERTIIKRAELQAHPTYTFPDDPERTNSIPRMHRKGTRNIPVVVDGEYYFSIREASDALGVNINEVCRRVHSTMEKFREYTIA
jgi:predicted GIY-YIG superfamily endonuclease